MSSINIEIPSIEDSFEKFERYPSVRERYYKCFYYHSDADSPPDHCVLFHSNKVCIITLGPLHPILKDHKEIVNLDFQISDKVDRRENKVIGKTKKGAQHIKPDSVLCFAECTDGNRYPIYGCVSGKLIEVNEQLLTNYKLISEKPFTDGYIAIVLPTKKEFDPLRDHRLTAEE